MDDTLVEKHWGGYAAFSVDISEFVHSGTNRVKVALKNNEGNNLAPASADFNFNATLGNVKLYTSPVVPDMIYGYDGFHVTSDVALSSATIEVKTSVPTGATVTCEISDGTYHYGASGSSTGDPSDPVLFSDCPGRAGAASGSPPFPFQRRGPFSG